MMLYSPNENAIILHNDEIQIKRNGNLKMAHQFTVNETIHGVSIEDFSRLVADTALHEAVCKRIPGENLEIIESAINGDIYTLRREYNLDVNIPDVAKRIY